MLGLDTERYLSRAYYMDTLIKANILELTQLRAIAESVTSALSADGRVQTKRHKDRIGGIIAKLIDLERRIEADVDQYLVIKADIRARINRVEDPRLKVILLRRYVIFDKWYEIADGLGIDERYLYKLHKKAVKEFDKI